MNCQVVQLIGENSKAVPYYQPIVGVFLPIETEDIGAELKRLFPREAFPEHWVKYP